MTLINRDMAAAKFERFGWVPADTGQDESDLFFTGVLDHLPTHIAVLDELGKILFVNAAWRNFAEENGSAAAKVSEGVNYLQVCSLPTADEAPESAHFAQGIRQVLSGKISTFELEYPCHSPLKQRWFIGRVSALPTEGPQRILIAHEEITHRKQTEEELAVSEARCRMLSEESADVVYIRTPAGRFRDINPAGIKLLGYEDREELLSGDIDQELYANADDRHRIIEKLLREGFVKDVAVDLRKKDGSRLSVSETAMVERDARGNVCGFHGFFRIIGNPQELAQPSPRSQKMELLGTRVSGVAHDFNNILAAILGYAGMAKVDLQNSNRAQSDISEIIKAAARGKHLVQQILTFSKMGEPQRAPVQLRAILKEVTRLLQSTLPANIEIEQNLRISNDVITADATQIYQIVMNLCTNAIHAMGSGGGRLTLQLDSLARAEAMQVNPHLSRGGYMRLTVRDNGHGMDRATAARIFEPFFTTHKDRDGTGLGLSIVHDILASHHGHIEVESVPNEGTTFRLYFPQAFSTEEKESCGETTLTGNEHILFVDDLPSLASLGKILLERLGYTVSMETSSLEALKTFRKDPDQFDLVVADHIMPGMTGLELAAAIKEVRPNLAILILNSYGSATAGELKAAGIDEQLTKPVDLFHLSRTVRKLLDQHKNEGS